MHRAPLVRRSDTNDEKDEVAQYEAWRERELLHSALRETGVGVVCIGFTFCVAPINLVHPMCRTPHVLTGAGT